MKAYWSAQPNFGDCLTPFLFRQLGGLRLRHVKPAKAKLFGIGSVAERIPEGYQGFVYGTGRMFRHTPLNLSTARVIALRGPLTLDGSGAECELLADPGLLICRLQTPQQLIKKKVGLLPHFIDKDLTDHHHGEYIDIESGVMKVIEATSAFECIKTSALHGLILCDALGIPSMWIPHPDVLGDGTKFEDYGGSFDESLEPNVWRMADQARVKAKASKLFAGMKGIVG